MPMLCQRHKVPVEMYRVVNQAGTLIGQEDVSGTAKARCSRCSMVVDCAYCPKCENKICVPCYNKHVENHGKPPKLGPSLGETSSI